MDDLAITETCLAILVCLLSFIPDDKREGEKNHKRNWKKPFRVISSIGFGIALIVVNQIQSGKAEKRALDIQLGSAMCPTFLPILTVRATDLNGSRLPVLLVNPDSQLNLFDVRFGIRFNHNLFPDPSFEGHSAAQSQNLNLFPHETLPTGAYIGPVSGLNVPVNITIQTRRTQCEEDFDLHARPVVPGSTTLKWNLSNLRKLDHTGKPLHTPDMRN